MFSILLNVQKKLLQNFHLMEHTEHLPLNNIWSNEFFL
ncbi:hypothetical protein Phage132_156 [Escherichia phage 132]|nr:hypothetical protein Phage132_156 [Escherichia phage 132]